MKFALVRISCNFFVKLYFFHALWTVHLGEYFLFSFRNVFFQTNINEFKRKMKCKCIQIDFKSIESGTFSYILEIGIVAEYSIWGRTRSECHYECDLICVRGCLGPQLGECLSFSLPCHFSLDSIKFSVEKRSLGYISRFRISCLFALIFSTYTQLCNDDDDDDYHYDVDDISIEPCDDITIRLWTMNRHRWTSDRTKYSVFMCVPVHACMNHHQLK